ncbi:GNAT family N-acetyltransferase [Desulfovibrio sp. OttesenSCG-928-C14]|nr:GNAT family N-acetyltransferase [Desulfovibrio sp. OttesenSCG-928-C14]
MKYTIKQATAEQVGLLAAIEIAAADIFPPGSIPDHIRSDSTPVEMLLEAVQEGLLWVALAGDDKPVGYALVRLTEGFALLAQMDVHPEHMRQGIGAALIAQVAEQLRLRKKTVLYLTTFTHVPWNAPFYAKQGFVAMNSADVPAFLKDILEEEKDYGLANRTAMYLEL